MKQPPMGKAKDHAPGEEEYGGPQRTIYRDGYHMGRAGATAEHNPHTGRAARAVWEAGRKRAEQDAGQDES